MLAWTVIGEGRLVPWHLADSTRFRSVRLPVSDRVNEATPKAATAMLNSAQNAKYSHLHVRDK